MAAEPDKLLKFISDSEMGKDVVLHGPFGARRVTYADYTASGRALVFLEGYITDHVLPWYGNTHTVTAAASRQMTLMREEARLIVRNSVRASEHDCVLFTGSGTTGAVNLLVHAMGLRPSLGDRDPPIVFHGPFEHHSNLLPWREIGAEMVAVPESLQGQVDLEQLEAELKERAGCDRLLIGVFSAASNLTGVLTDPDPVTSLLHRYGALAFWDYATAAPYVDMNMNPLTSGQHPTLVAKDAMYFSPHKFIGGVDSPGVLVAKKRLFQSSSPYTVGGGTVFFVTPSSQLYLQEVESREEGGTPAIVGSIRAGLAMQLKQAVGPDTILQRERELCQRVQSSWREVPNLILLGPWDVPKLPVFSFLMRHMPSGRLLHYNFVCALLNDLFGIQARGGCSCAGPYAQSLLGISPDLADRYRKLLLEDRRLDRTHLRRQGEYSEREVLRPGVSRMSFTYFMSDKVVDYIIRAVAMVAKHGWKLLPLYDVDPNTGLFLHLHNHSFADRQWLGSISYKNGLFHCPGPTEQGPAPDFEECLREAQELFDMASHCHGDVTRSLGDQSVLLSNSAEHLRWFLYPQEAQSWLRGMATAPPTVPPFTPKHYSHCTTSCPPVLDAGEHVNGLNKDSEQTAGQQQESEQTAGQQQESEQTAGQQQESEQTAGQLQESEQTAGRQQESEQTAGQLQESEQTAGQQQESEQTAGQLQESGQMAGQQQESEQTAGRQQESEQTAGQLQESEQTAGQLQESGQTAGQQQESEQTAGQQQESEQTAGQQQENEQTAGQQQESEQTAGRQQESEQTAGQQQENEQTAGQQQESEQTAGQLQESEQTAGQQQESGQTAGQLQESEQTAGQQQESEQTAGQQQESELTAGQQESEQTDEFVATRDVGVQCSWTAPVSGAVLASEADNGLAATYHHRAQSSLHIAMATHHTPAMFHCPPKCILKPTMEAIEEYSMIREGDRVLVCLSGGKDSLSLLHTLRQYHFIAQAKGKAFTLGAVTVDPGTSSYDPSPLIPYLQGLGVTYFYEKQGILEKALEVGCSSICAFCSRMKRGRLYACARREGYNVLALGQHLDDLAESFLMGAFHNGFLRTMKAHYTIQDGDLRVIRPFVYVREKDLRVFAEGSHLPIIPENCPACFDAPKERHRMKQLLAGQELVFPRLFTSLKAAMKPLVARSTTGQESSRAYLSKTGLAPAADSDSD